MTNTDTIALIRRIRAERQLTQAALATRLGVTRVTVVRWENGQRRPQPMAWRALEAMHNGRQRCGQGQNTKPRK